MLLPNSHCLLPCKGRPAGHILSAERRSIGLCSFQWGKYRRLEPPGVRSRLIQKPTVEGQPGVAAMLTMLANSLLVGSRTHNSSSGQFKHNPVINQQALRCLGCKPYLVLAA